MQGLKHREKHQSVQGVQEIMCKNRRFLGEKNLTKNKQ
jgi:hypothetical protein